MIPCHLCGHQELITIDGFETLPRVTSDCKAYASGGCLQLCPSCGNLIKPPDPKWFREIEEIYGNYTIYHQAQGQEQPVIMPETGELTSRSVCLLSRMREEFPLPEHGRLIDVGCGNGAFLRSFHRFHPHWKLAGTEFNNINKEAVEAIPQVEALYTEGVDKIPGQFDAASLVHVLEHIPYPGPLLDALCQKLSPHGLLIVDLPDYQLNAFDFVVADHCTHFTESALIRYLAARGFAVSKVTGAWIPKERVALSRPGRPHQLPELDLAGTKKAAIGAIEFMRRLMDVALELRHRFSGPIGIFGTSIAGTWLHGAVGGCFDFWVEEDRNRVSRDYLGKPVYLPEDAPPGDVLLAVSPTLARLLSEKFRPLATRFHIP